MARMAAIGECMIELSPRPGGLYGLGFGGDTLNTAVYLSRLGVAVDYLTALGDDSFSDRMIALWRDEGVGTGHVPRLAGRLPGLYVIEVGPGGERRFSHWRERAPARELFALPETPGILAAMRGYDVIYLSGISLSLYGEAGRRVLFGGLDGARNAGARIVFDGNYRPRNWGSPDEARDAMSSMLARTDIALTSFDDEQAVHGDASIDETLARLRRHGIAEIVVKQGADGCVIADLDHAQPLRATPQGPVVDTTAAGDSFNAAYLAARLAGRATSQAAVEGHRLAGTVIGHPGAIIPRAAMPPAILVSTTETDDG